MGVPEKAAGVARWLGSMGRSLIVLFIGCVLAAQPASVPARAPILVELFTSEGCSDCPPADRMLAQLDPHVVVLSEHVDYWDRQGWKDRFSSHEFTLRQEDYAQRFHIDGPYTPQMVVDGVAQFVGSDAPRAKDEIGKAGQRPKARVELARTADGIKITVSDAPGPAGVFLALAEDSAESDVRAGENKGRHLAHVAVLRSLRKIGTVKRGGGFSEMVTLPASAAEQRAIVFLQEGTSGPVSGAAEIARR
jgi:hypothetical protein